MKYIIKNAFVLNGLVDMEPVKKDILVEDGIIKDINDFISINKVKEYNLNGKYLMPGLINLHVHLPGSGMPKDTKKQNKESVDRLMSNPITKKILYLMCKKYARIELLSGVTTIRTVGGLRDIDSTIRDKAKKNNSKLPRMFVSNMAISVPNGHMAGILAYIANSKEEAIHYVDVISKTNPDLIKLMITGGVLDAKVKGEPGILRMPLEYVKACCDRSHELGYKVSSHVESTEGVKVALEGGVDTIEHGALCTDEVIDLFKKNGSCHVCTISPAVPLALFPMEFSNANELTQYNGNVVLNGIIDCANKCLENGIKVGLGTDTACPFVTHYDMWRELCYFKKYCNISNSFALHTATQVNAEILGIDNITGTVEVGKQADFLVADNNPLVNLEYLRNPSFVFYRGSIIKKPKIKKYSYVEEELDKYL